MGTQIYDISSATLCQTGKRLGLAWVGLAALMSDVAGFYNISFTEWFAYFRNARQHGRRTNAIEGDCKIDVSDARQGNISAASICSQKVRVRKLNNSANIIQPIESTHT